MSADDPLRAAPQALTVALADELTLASQMLADLAADLCSNPETLRRHLMGLQQIDRVTQMQMAVAGVLRGGGSDVVMLDDMRRRMVQRVQAGTDAGQSST